MSIGGDEESEAITSESIMSDDMSAMKAAIDRWIYDLGDEEHELRKRLRDVREHLEVR
jgi:hypothetical protein